MSKIKIVSKKEKSAVFYITGKYGKVYMFDTEKLARSKFYELTKKFGYDSVTVEAIKNIKTLEAVG